MINLRLALRNLLRNRRRSTATVLALMIGTAAVLLFSGYRTCIEYTLHTHYVRQFGHFQIVHRDLLLYGAGNPVEYSIRDYSRLISEIRADQALAGHLRVLTPTLQFGGIASSPTGNVSRAVFGYGVIAPDLGQMRQWAGWNIPLPAPPFALERAGPDAAIVGYGVARILFLCAPLKLDGCPIPPARLPVDGESMPGDIADLVATQTKPGPGSLSATTINLLASSAGGAPNVVSLKVVGAERMGFKELDESYLGLQLERAQRLVFGRDEPRVTAIVVQIKDSGSMEVVRKRLNALLAERFTAQPLSVLSFSELNPFFDQTVQMFNAIFGFIFVLISSIVLFTVGNTMNTAVMERTVEIGTIRAMGVRQRGVQRLFVFEGVLLGASGALLGVAGALVISWTVNSLGLTWLPPGSGDRLPLLLLVWGQWNTMAFTFFGLIVVATLSAWWPARRASRLVIVEALRHV